MKAILVIDIPNTEHHKIDSMVADVKVKSVIQGGETYNTVVYNICELKECHLKPMPEKEFVLDKEFASNLKEVRLLREG